ncbi:response regulator [Desulfosarcina sp.]|uniref:response regulator n=1 Tax=Desulfosarcina sp. TaxID=2027861 RepID=UPI003970F661
MKTDILIVEDESVVAADLEIKLKHIGFAVAGIASQGQEALDMARTRNPQLILMDIQLKGPLDGIETAKAVQERLDVPVVYLTAHSDQATLSRAKLTGPFGYILKPFDEHDLKIQIELALFKHRAERQLRQQRELLRVTLSSIGDAVIATDADSCITFINPVAASLIGWPLEEATGKQLKEVFGVMDGFTRKVLTDPFKDVLASGRNMDLKVHTLLLGHGGREVPIESSAAPIRDLGGCIIGVVLVFRDISDRRRAEAEKDAMIADLKEAMGKIKTLSGMLPICSACKKIRDDKGYWNQIETYIRDHSEAEFTHGICPDCIRKLYPDYHIGDA